MYISNKAKVNQSSLPLPPDIHIPHRREEEAGWRRFCYGNENTESNENFWDELDPKGTQRNGIPPWLSIISRIDQVCELLASI